MPLRPVPTLLAAIASIALALGAVAPAQAVDDASIAGHVSDAATAAPLAGAIVELYPFARPPYDAASETLVATTTTDATGAYAFAGLTRSAMYQLKFTRASDPSDVEWYRNAGDRPSAGFAYANDGTDFDATLGDAVTFQWVATGRPSILGDPTVGSTLTVDPGTWVPTPDRLSYQWTRDGGPISGATDPSFTPSEDDFGAVFAVEVTGHRAAYPDTKTRSARVQIVSFDGFLQAIDADADSTITGRFDSRAALVGDRPLHGFPTEGDSYLVLSSGAARDAYIELPPGSSTAVSTWLDNGPIRYGGDLTTLTVGVQPPAGASCLAIDFAFGTKEAPNTYTRDIMLVESPVSDVTFAEDDTSFATAPNNTAVDSHGQLLSPDSLDLVATQGEGIDRWTHVLTAKVPLTAGVTNVILSVQDVADQAADSVALFDNLRYIDDPVCESGEQPPIEFVTYAGRPQVGGERVAGATLIVSTGGWEPAPVDLDIQWLRNGVPIPGETTDRYTLTPADVGTSLAARVTGSKAGYGPRTVTSESTGPIGDGKPYGSVPTIAGRPNVDAVLKGYTHTWYPEVATFSYAWLRDGKPIPGATAITYSPKPADLGHRIAFRVTASNAGFAVSQTSKPSAKIGLATFTDSGANPRVVSSSSSFAVGSVLTLASPPWTPTPSAYLYQWRRDGSAIAGANGRSYRLTDADVGARVTCELVGLSAGYLPARTVSAPTSPVVR